jgi:hypothetical protein
MRTESGTKSREENRGTGTASAPEIFYHVTKPVRPDPVLNQDRCVGIEYTGIAVILWYFILEIQFESR